MGNRASECLQLACSIALGAGLFLGGPSSARAAPIKVGLPTNDAFRPAPCPVGPQADLTAQGVECGILTVPERHLEPGGRTIALAVAVLKARSGAAALDPVVYLEGGPGGGAIVGLGFWLGTSLRDDHDIIVLDQRGTGFSKPSLACTELSFPADERRSNEDYFAYYETNVRDCRARLLADGIDLSAYTTNESAADIEALRVALGIGRWSLYGISYGTRLALEVMRDFPAGVGSVVLDSAYPPQVRAFEDHGARLDRAFDELMGACAADPPCAAAYPGLGAAFGPTMDALEAKVWGAPDVVPGHTIEAGLRGFLYNTQIIGMLPALVHSAEIGNTAPFLGLLETHQVPPEVDSLGMSLSVECAERGSNVDPAAVAADAAAHSRWRVLLARDWQPRACAIWDVPPARAEDLEPVRSAIPTLILAGSLDPVTPPAYAALTASTLDRATLVEVPSFGHGVTMTRCPSDIRDAFLADPETPPDASCVASILPAEGRFVTDQVANAGLGRMYTRLLFGLNPPTLGDWLIAAYVFGLFAISIVAWIVLAGGTLIRRRPSAAAPTPTGEALAGDDLAEAIPPSVSPAQRRSGVVRIARILGLATIVADLVFVIGLVLVLAGQPDAFVRNLGLPRGMAWLYGVADVGALTAIGFAATTVVMVVIGAGRRRTRVHLVALATACLIASGVLRYYAVIERGSVLPPCAPAPVLRHPALLPPSARTSPRCQPRWRYRERPAGSTPNSRHPTATEAYGAELDRS